MDWFLFIFKRGFHYYLVISESESDAWEQILWREIDATRNSIQALAQFHYSHNEVLNLNTNQLQNKLFEELGINWDSLEPKYKRGVYIKRFITDKPFTKEEIDLLPLKHNARQNPDLCVKRSVIKEIEYPIFSKIINKVEVIFDDDKPSYL